MTFTDLMYATGDILESSFAILPVLGNNFNYIAIVIGFIGLIYWLSFQIKKTKQAKRDNTYV